MSFSPLLLLHLRKSKDIFPMFTLRRCVSDAEGSSNGPRYSAQDKITGCMYEVRCIPLKMADSGRNSDAALQIHQKRLDVLIAASRRNDLLSSVSLPIDAYIRRLSSTKEFFLVSVSAFTGLSLGDVIRSGCQILEKADFEDILSCVEAYGLESMRLPPHGNLGPSALLRQLTVRSGAVEMENPSRWVIGDWLLLGDNIPPKTPDDVLRDLEWLLHLVFSKLNVLSDPDGTILHKNVVEKRINETLENVKIGLMTGVRRSRRVSLTCSVTLNDGDGKAVKAQLPSENHPVSIVHSESDSQKALTNGNDGADKLLDRIALHRHKLRQEQQLIQNHLKERKQSNENSSSLCTHEFVFNNKDSPRRRVRFVEKLCFDESFNTVVFATDRARQRFGAQKDVLLTSLTAALDAGIKRSVSDRKIEIGAKCVRREALLSMLMRLAATSRRRNTFPFLNGTSAKPTWQGEVSSNSRNLAEVVELPLHIDCRADNNVDNTFTKYTSPRKLRQNLRCKANLLRLSSTTKLNGKKYSAQQCEAKSNLEDVTHSGSALITGKKLMLDSKNGLSTRENLSSRNVKNEQKVSSSGTASSCLNATEKSLPVHSILKQVSTGRSSRRFLNTGGRTRSCVASRRHGLTSLPRNQADGNKTTSTLNYALLQRTLRKQHQLVPTPSQQLRSVTSSRLSPTGLNNVNSIGRVSGGQGQYFNEA